jgi:hypothetical protein
VNNTGAGEASAGGGRSNGEEGSGDGQGDDEDGGDGDAEMAVGVEHATVELNEKGECKRDPEFWAPPLKLPTGGSVYIERFKEATDKGAAAGTSPTADEIIEPPVFLKPRRVSGRLHPARWAQMGHTETENFLMHLGRLYLRICTRAPPTNPDALAPWQNKALYIQQAVLGCFASYQEDMKLRQDQARQKGNKVAPDLSEAFEFYRRATLPPATNTPATQNDNTNPQDSEVFPNPALEKVCPGESQVRLQADGHWQAHVIERFGTDWVGALADYDPVKPLTPAERAQRAWRLDPPAEGAPENVPPNEASGKMAKGKADTAKKGQVTPEALQEAVATTAVRQALEGKLAREEQLLAALDVEQAAGGGEKEGGERGSRGESSAGTGARKGKRPAEPVPTPEEVVRAGAKRRKGAEKGKKAATGEEKSAELECHPMEETAAGEQSAAGEQVTPALEAREGEKAATGVEQSAGMVCPPREEGTAGLQSSVGVVTAPAREVLVPPVGPAVQPVAQSEGFEAESDDVEEVFSVETEGVDVCEAVQRFLPENIIASEAMDRLAQRERWAPFDEESEIVAFRIFVNPLLDAAQRGVLTTLTQTECARLARNNMVWMGRAGRHTSSWDEVEAQGVSYEELASPETTAMLESLTQEAVEAEAPIDGAGPSHATLREEGPSQGAAARAQREEPRQPPVTSRAVQTESATEEGTFLLEPLLQNAMSIAIHDLLEVEVPWLNMVLLADELLDHLYERLEELRDGVMTRPMRMVGPEQDEDTIKNAAVDGTPQQPPPPAGPGDGHPGGPPQCQRGHRQGSRRPQQEETSRRGQRGHRRCPPCTWGRRKSTSQGPRMWRPCLRWRSREHGRC